MERLHGVWHTFTGFNGLGLDADGNPIRGTPHGPNSVLFPTPLPTPIPGRIVINEVLARPRYDWEGAGGVTSADEFIELYNRGPLAVHLRGWTLDDVGQGGSSPFDLPPLTLEPGEYAVFFRTRTSIALNDSGDSVRLSAPDGEPVDKIHYLPGQAVNLSYGRLPDGDEALVYGLWPTPGEDNERYTPPSYPAGSVVISEVAWAGTGASPNDEWIELWNPGRRPINLFGWTLTDDSDVHIHLAGVLQPDGYALLERTDDRSVPGLAAFAVYTGALADDGERLRLLDPAANEIDVVNPQGGMWPAGDPATRASMELFEGTWLTFVDDFTSQRDASGQPIRGSPAATNSPAARSAIAQALMCGGEAPPTWGVCP
jgi:hypothetical protein